MKNETTKTVQSLRQEGYRVRVQHSRYLRNGALIPMREYYTKFTKEERESHPIDPRGGFTFIELETPDGKDIKTRADCSQKDNFNYEMGRRIALGRAFSLLDRAQKISELTVFPANKAV